jgi:hypothetical protein
MKPQISEKGLRSLSVFVFQCKFIMFKMGSHITFQTWIIQHCQQILVLLPSLILL